MLLFALTGLMAWKTARANGHGAPWTFGLLGTFFPLLGLWAAATPPEDGPRLQEEPPSFWLQPGSNAQKSASLSGGYMEHSPNCTQAEYEALIREYLENADGKRA